MTHCYVLQYVKRKYLFTQYIHHHHVELVVWYCSDAEQQQAKQFVLPQPGKAAVNPSPKAVLLPEVNQNVK